MCVFAADCVDLLCDRLFERVVLERPSSQMSYLDHFLKETSGSNTNAHGAVSALAVNLVSYLLYTRPHVFFIALSSAID